MVQAALSPAAPKPAHVADGLVYDFDLHADPGLLADPHRRILELVRTAPPVFWTPRNDRRAAGRHRRVRRRADRSGEIGRRLRIHVDCRRAASCPGFPEDAWTAARPQLFLPAADLDPSEFPRPDKYDLDRENNVHVAFGVGPHRCLGSHLARVELQVLYEEMLARLPAFRLDPDFPPVFHGGHVIGIERMHLRWDA
jgi:hypothetical protein